MGRWLAKFSADIPESRTDRTDRRTEKPLLSVLSVPDIDISAKIIPSQPVKEPTSPLQAAENIVIEPAAANPRPVYFWRNDGGIHGPARVIDLEKIGTGDAERFWVIVDYQEQTIWVRSDRLRSKRAFEQQITPKRIELIREP